MTEENIHNEQQPTPLGQALKDFRLATNLSVEEIALKLNLKTSVIVNLEDNLDNVIKDGIYPLIYLRGYLVNYSKELKFPDIESYSDFKELNHPADSVTSLENTYIFNDKPKLSKEIILFTLLIIIGAVIAISYFGNDSSNTKKPVVDELNEEQPKASDAITPPASNTEKITKEKQIPKVVEEEYVAISDVKEAVIQPTINDTETALTIAPEISPLVEKEIVKTPKIKPVVAASAVQPAKEEVQTITEGNTLKLLFEEKSWAVVTDAKGKRLAFGLYQSGKELDLNGAAPFKLKIGNPTAVVIYYDNKLVENDFVQGKMANFSLPE